MSILFALAASKIVAPLGAWIAFPLMVKLIILTPPLRFYYRVKATYAVALAALDALVCVDDMRILDCTANSIDRTIPRA